MSAPKHTPGPWIIREGDFGESEFVITTEARQELGIVSICEINVYFDGDIGAEQKANARLIAAAPELLAALNEIAAWGDGEAGPHMDEPGAACIARAAIAKATGGQA